jgi:hypothetical protein
LVSHCKFQQFNSSTLSRVIDFQQLIAFKMVNSKASHRSSQNASQSSRLLHHFNHNARSSSAVEISEISPLSIKTSSGSYNTNRNAKSNRSFTSQLPRDTLAVSKNFPNISANIDEISQSIQSNIEQIDDSRLKFQSEISTLQQSSKNDLVSSFRDLCTLLIKNNAQVQSLHQQILSDCSSILSIIQKQEIKNTKRDESIDLNSNKIQSVSTRQSCSDDLCKIFITLTCPRETESLTNSKDLINDSLNILERVQVDTNTLGITPIKRAHMQHIKTDKEIEPTLCIVFQNPNIATLVRRQIDKFNSELEAKMKLDELRYTHRRFWSSNIYSLLKISNELKRVGLLRSVRVSHCGIIVTYSKCLNSPTKSFLVSCYKDINLLRRLVNDHLFNTHCELIYNATYFALPLDKRDEMRDKSN